MNEAKEEIEELIRFYNSTKNEKIKPGLEDSIKCTTMYEQFKECIENSLKYLSPGCRKAMFQVMCKNIDEFKFAGEIEKLDKFFTEQVNEEAGKVMMEGQVVTDDYDSITNDDCAEKFGSIVIEPLEEYEMNKSRRGRFFIICAKRPGYERDIENYEFIAKTLGFADEDVIVFDDKERDYVLQKFKEYKEEGDPDHDCVVVACSSHGKKKDMLQLKHGEELPISKLVEHLSSFTGPKIFFIQACRGVQAEKKASFTTNDEMFKSSECTTSTNLNDLLLVFSTIPDKVSFRDSNEGSYFVRILKEEFEKHDHDNFGIIELLTKTISTLATKQFAMKTPDGNVVGELKQMACFRNSLTKHLVFRRKVQGSRVESSDVSRVESSDMSRVESSDVSRVESSRSDVGEVKFMSYQPECSSDDDEDAFVTSSN